MHACTSARASRAPRLCVTRLRIDGCIESVPVIHGPLFACLLWLVSFVYASASQHLASLPGVLFAAIQSIHDTFYNCLGLRTTPKSRRRRDLKPVFVTCALLPLLISAVDAVAPVSQSPSSQPPVDSSATELITSIAARHILLCALPTRGHMVPLQRLAQELVLRGHRVSFATHDDGRDWVDKVSGARFISLGKSILTADTRRDVFKAASHDVSYYRGVVTLATQFYVPEFEVVYDALLKHLNSLSISDRPHAIVADVYTFGAHAAAHSANIPLIINSPTPMLRFELDDYQLPAWGSGYSVRLSLFQRCASLLMPRVLGIALSSSLVVLNSARRHRGLPMIMSYEQLFQHSLLLHNTAPGVDHARAAVPANHLYLGPILPRYAPEPQSIGMQTWLDLSLAREGKLAAIAVLTGIGSMTHLENWHVKHLYKGLTDQRLRVLWSLPSEYRPLLGAGIHPLFRFKTNLAPLSVFSHPSIKVVICSCGASMAFEALLHGKPLICIPTLADQLEVASRIVDGGAGLFLDKSMFEASEVRAKVMALITNSSFAANARRMGLILSAAGGLTRAVNTIETVTLTGSISPWLNLQLENIPWHQAVHLDLLLLLLAVACMFIGSMHLSLRFAADTYRRLRESPVTIALMKVLQDAVRTSTPVETAQVDAPAQDKATELNPVSSPSKS